MVFRALGMEFLGSDKKRRRSFVYSTSLCTCPPLLIPVNVLYETAKGSMATLKSRGDRGHHCLVALNKEKYFDILLFVLMAACGPMYNRFTQEQNEGPNPKFLGTKSNIYAQFFMGIQCNNSLRDIITTWKIHYIVYKAKITIQLSTPYKPCLISMNDFV